MYPQFYGYDNPYPMFNQPAQFLQQCYGMTPNMQMMLGKFVVYAAAMLTEKHGLLSRHKHCTNLPRIGNLTSVNVYLGKCSSINTA